MIAVVPGTLLSFKTKTLPEHYQDLLVLGHTRLHDPVQFIVASQLTDKTRNRCVFVLSSDGDHGFNFDPSVMVRLGAEVWNSP